MTIYYQTISDNFMVPCFQTSIDYCDSNLFSNDFGLL